MVKIRKIAGVLLVIGVLLALAGGLNQLYGAAVGVPTIYRMLGPYALPVAIVGIILILIGVVLILIGGVGK
jgi:hypothetical protein